MHIGIVADGGFEKGMGHVVRMKRLAEELKQRCLITFYTNQESEPFLHEEHWHVIVMPELQQHEFILREIKNKKLDLLLFDILGAPAELLRKIKAETYAKIVLFEEKNEKAIQLSDAVINGIYGDIRSRVYDQGNTRIYEGPDYLILHPGFLAARNDYTLKKKCCNIVVALGGSDPKRLIFKVLAAADQVPAMNDKNMMFVMGSASPHQEAVRRHIQKKPQYTVIGQTNDMAGMMKQADAAIVAGGISLYEAICIGVPCLVLSQVEHQTATAKTFAEQGAALDLGLGELVSDETLIYQMSRIISSYPLRLSLHKGGRPLVDGKGIKRVSAILQDLYDQKV
ncbi:MULTISPECIES: PseG/SpsG family protein [Bacillus]|uniref:PseG/SpsG family protein n=1 Tax=Bacillus rugosus TaxID=2715209 RepID=A0ACD3ZY06_9BACI|nr:MULTISPECIES: PseG/SpsG family protein [Bacillus]MBY4602813.1 spore coat protein [Bacillus sp. SPARC3]MEC1549585.1 PseG/SpsG family protein [Bacillus rugosus]UPV78903.1 PseG/SpsG family protein [Bacillus rugosus]